MGVKMTYANDNAITPPLSKHFNAIEAKSQGWQSIRAIEAVNAPLVLAEYARQAIAKGYRTIYGESDL